MRFILTLLMTSAMAFGIACQSAASSPTETKNEKPADLVKTDKPAKKEVAEKKADSYKVGDGHNNDGEAPRISLKDAKKDFDAGNAIFIDTRSATSFKNEHVKGAINLPLKDFANSYRTIPKDKKIIAYCS